MKVTLECDGDQQKWLDIFTSLENDWDITDSITYQMDYDTEQPGIHHTEFGDMKITVEETPEEERIVGFVFDHGGKDYSLWQTDGISDEDSKKILEILEKYRNNGQSVRNVYNEVTNILREEVKSVIYVCILAKGTKYVCGSPKGYDKIYETMMKITDNDHEISSDAASWCELASVGETYEFREGVIEIKEVDLS